MKLAVFLSLAILIFLSCNTDKKQRNSINQKLDNITEKETINLEEEEDFRIEKREVDYQENKEVLDLLIILPDSVTPNRNWKESERKEFRNIIKKNNFITDTVPFADGFKISPKSLNVYINEEETWNFHIYKIQSNEYIFIINNSVIVYNPKNRRKNDILAFLYKDSILNNVLLENLLERDIKTELINHSLDDIVDYDEAAFDSLSTKYALCDLVFSSSERPFFNYYFRDSIISIDLGSKYNFKETEFCLNGNYVVYKFNPSTKKFELSDKGWGQ